jgi:3-deoxy-D-manno-octulosonate 8-phosphate phosphatase (KDO 8-P phosphatase)
MKEVCAPEFEIPSEVIERAKIVRLVIFDVDGVLTDGSLFIGDDGQEYKAFNSKDGHGIKMMMRNGVDGAIITGRTSRVVEHRMADLGLTNVRQGCAEKLPVYEEMIAELGLSEEQTAFIGDDIVDLPIMLRAGLAVATHDAHPMVKRYSHWITPSNGGCGAARDLAEMLMYAQGTYESEMLKYL